MSRTADPLLSNEHGKTATQKTNKIESSVVTMDGGSQDSRIPNIIEQYDATYIQEVSKLDLGNILSTDPTDHIAMRQWLKDVYMPLPKVPQIKRIRTPVPIEVEYVPILYGEDNHFSIRIYDAVDKEVTSECLRPAVIVLHGGGWIHGSPEVDEDVSKLFASELRAVVIGVDYRLAPEHQFPIPSNDCYEVLNWISTNSEQYKIDTARIALWGASAGGNLAASVALRDSAENETSRIRHINLVVPVTCHPILHPPILRSNQASMNISAASNTPEQAMAVLLKLWDKYAGTQYADPYASVLLAQPRDNHPSVHITVAGSDRLRDEGIAYALRLRDAGVDTQLEIVPGVPHELTVSPSTPVAAQFFRNQIRVLNCALNTEF